MSTDAVRRRGRSHETRTIGDTRAMSANAPLMAGKRGLVMGVANDRSIAWAIARTVHAHGGEVALTYQGEALRKRVAPLAQSIGCDAVLPCDVTDDASLDAVFETLGENAGDGSTSSSTPSPTPTRSSSRAATSRRRRRTSA